MVTKFKINFGFPVVDFLDADEDMALRMMLMYHILCFSTEKINNPAQGTIPEQEHARAQEILRLLKEAMSYHAENRTRLFLTLPRRTRSMLLGLTDEQLIEYSNKLVEKCIVPPLLKHNNIPS